MAAATKTSVKSNFETGDIPTQAQFQELIDSYLDHDDTIRAIASAAQDRGRTGFVEIIGTANVTANTAGAFGRTFVGAGTTAAGVALLNVMTTDTTQTITGNKTFEGLVRISAAVTVINTKANRTVLLINTDATADTAFTPRLDFLRQWVAGNVTDDSSIGGLQWNAEASGAAAQHTWAAQKVLLASAAASAGTSQIEFHTRSGGALGERMRIKQGVVLASATNNDLGTGTLNATRVYDDGIQITPHQQAFAWAVHPGTGTVSLTNSINIASITDNNTGDYSLVFSTAASDANYGIQVYAGVSATSSPPTAITWSYVITTTAGGARYGILRGSVGASAVDVDRITVTVWDDNPAAGTRVA